MAMIADILLVAGALGAAFYCMILSRRLSRFTDLEKGVGGAVAVLSVQVDDMTKTLERARKAANSSTVSLEELTDRAESVAGRLEILVASMHDIPEEPQEAEPIAAFSHSPVPTADPVFVRHRGSVLQAAE